MLILTVVCAVTYAIEIMFGLGGTTLMLPVMRAWFPEKTLVVYSVMPQIMVAIIGLAASPRVIDMRFLARVLAFAAAGTVAGLLLFTRLTDARYVQLLAWMLVLTGAYILARPHVPRLGSLTGHGLDLLAGISQGLFGISGPISMTRFLGTFTGKTVVRNYGLAFFLALNLVRTAGYASSGVFDEQTAWMMLVSAPVLGIVLWRANRWHFRVSESGFRRGIGILVVIGGLSLLWR